MGWAEKLETAIITGNMEAVREFYEHLYNEKAPTAPKLIDSEEIDKLVEERVNSILTPLLNALSQMKIGAIKTITPLQESKKENLVEVSNTDGGTSYETEVNRTNHKGEQTKTKFITGLSTEDTLPGYTDLVKTAAKHANAIKGRDKYEPEIITCLCGNKFDYKKEYPLGHDTTSQPTCNSCKMGGIGKSKSKSRNKNK
jgi:hypothetical protein